MPTEFNIDLPPRYTYKEEQSSEENLKGLSEYIFQLHASLEEMFQRVFVRSSNTAESPTADNIGSVDQDGNVTDSGVDISTDGTLGDNSDTSVPTEKAVVTYVAAQIAGGAFLPLAGGEMAGDIDFDQNEAINMVIENRAGSDPTSPVAGQMWYRTS